MAKLKVHEGDPTIPSVQGYINVVDNLVLKKDGNGNYQNYEDFKNNKYKNTRPSVLQSYAKYKVDNTAYPCAVYHVDGTEVEIADNNCTIEVNVDENKATGKKSLANINFPEMNPGDVNYLKPYATAIHDLVKAKKEEEACKFLFGIMLLTRCR
jgi:hypothetical protein